MGRAGALHRCSLINAHPTSPRATLHKTNNDLATDAQQGVLSAQENALVAFSFEDVAVASRDAAAGCLDDLGGRQGAVHRDGVA